MDVEWHTVAEVISPQSPHAQNLNPGPFRLGTLASCWRMQECVAPFAEVISPRQTYTKSARKLKLGSDITPALSDLALWRAAGECKSA